MPAAITLNRFDLGARAGDGVPVAPQRWLIDQFTRFDVRPAGFAALDDAGAVVKRYREEQQANRRMAMEDGASDAKVDLTVAPNVSVTMWRLRPLIFLSAS